MYLKEFDSLEILKFSESKSEFKMHFHDSYVVSLIEKGAFIENNLIGIKGNILISHPFEVHENKIFDDNSYTVTSFYINPDIIKYLSKQENISFPEKLITDQNLFNLFTKYLSGLHSGFLENNILINCLEKMILIHSENNTFHDQPTKNSSILESMNYIEQNYNTKIKLDDLAKIAKQSKYYFTRQFKKNVGITPFEYINLQRIKQAKKHLREGMPIIETAISTGYYDQSHFYHYFKHYVGLSPSNYISSNILQEI